MVFGFITTIVLGALGWLRFAVISILLIFIDGLICSLIEDTYDTSNVISVQDAISDKYKFHSGIVSDYLSVDIICVMFIIKLILKLKK